MVFNQMKFFYGGYNIKDFTRDRAKTLGAILNDQFGHFVIQRDHFIRFERVQRTKYENQEKGLFCFYLQPYH